MIQSNSHLVLEVSFVFRITCLNVVRKSVIRSMGANRFICLRMEFKELKHFHLALQFFFAQSAEMQA